MFQLNWQEFIRRSHIARLPLHEQVRQFHWEQQRYSMLMEYVMNTSVSVAAAAGSGGGGKQTDVSQNGYVENNYIDDYFE